MGQSLNVPRGCYLYRGNSKIRTGEILLLKLPAMGNQTDGAGHRRSIVDEDMLVLRKRMHQLRMEDINYIPPQQWMEWEKKRHPTYDSDVCSSLLWLQNMLLDTRPSVVMAALAVISFSVLTSVLLLLIETSIPLRGVIMEWFSYLHG